MAFLQIVKTSPFPLKQKKGVGNPTPLNHYTRLITCGPCF